jgi:SAM-dependent methyltransferase
MLPRKVFFKLEPILRYFHYLIYKGSAVQCNVCNKKLRKFIQLKNKELLCPACGSLPRDRRLYELLSSQYLMKGAKVLDFSPARCLYRILKSNKDIEYTSTALAGDFMADKNYNITQIEAPIDSYDLIICYHILEHVDDDKKAMQELVRILRPNGTCLIQTPFKQGDIYENHSITSPQERLKHYGQEDHVRIYSADGLRKHLAKVGFEVTIREFNDESGNNFGLKNNETILICTKLNN